MGGVKQVKMMKRVDLHHGVPYFNVTLFRIF